MTRHLFVQELEELHNHVVKMGSIVEQSLVDTIAAFQSTDAELAKEIMDRDNEIDIMEEKIERECINLIAKQQPLATDLRRITSIMKIITDVERMADHCSDISEYIINLHQMERCRKPEHVEAMFAAMKNMVTGTIDCFVKSDMELANKIIEADDAVDDYFRLISAELTKMMQEDKEVVPQCVCYLMIIKYVERMADHATNIAEWIQFIITGELVTG